MYTEDISNKIKEYRPKNIKNVCTMRKMVSSPEINIAPTQNRYTSDYTPKF